MPPSLPAMMAFRGWRLCGKVRCPHAPQRVGDVARGGIFGYQLRGFPVKPPQGAGRQIKATCTSLTGRLSPRTAPQNWVSRAASCLSQLALDIPTWTLHTSAPPVQGPGTLLPQVPQHPAPQKGWAEPGCSPPHQPAQPGAALESKVLQSSFAPCLMKPCGNEEG